MTLANGKAYSYDNNGNMIARGSQILGYDAENRLTQVDSNGVLTAFGYADDGSRLYRDGLSSGTYQIWIGGLYEDKNGQELCHVFAGGMRVATFEPASGGPYASVWAPKTLWARTGEVLTAASSWPFAQGRTPATVLVTTLLMLLLLSITARRGWRWNPNAWIARRLRHVLLLLGRRPG